MKTRKQKIFLTAKIIIATLFIMIVALFVFRNALLQQAIAKVSVKMERKYNCHFSIKEASFVGFSGVKMAHIVLVPKNADTLFNIQKMETSISFLHLLVGDIQLGTLKISNGFVQLVKNKKGRNFDAFLKKDETNRFAKEKKDYAKVAYKIISKILNLVPTDMKVENLSFRLDDNGKKTTINFQNYVWSTSN